MEPGAWDDLSVFGSIHNTVYKHGQECTLGVIALLLILIIARARKDNDSANMKLPPGSFGWPLIGETIPFLSDGRAYCRSRRAKYGPLFRTHLFGGPFAVVCGADLIKKLHAAASSLEIAIPSSGQKLFQGGLTTTNGDCHNHHKRLIDKAMNPGSVKQFSERACEIIRYHLETWCERGEIVACEEARRLTVALALDFFIGLDFHHEDFDTAIQCLRDLESALFSIPVELPGFAFKRGMAARRKLFELVRKWCTSSDARNSYSVGPKLLTIYEEEGSEGALDDVCIDVVEMLWGGFSSLTSSLCTILGHMADNREIGQQIWTELQSEELECDQGDDRSRQSLSTSGTYRDHVVKEALRFKPPISGIFRLAKESIQLGDYIIPAGWKILVSITDTHEMTTTFDQQTVFDPSRWQRNTPSNKLEYVPFGPARRICPGKGYIHTVLNVFIREAVRLSEWTMINETMSAVTSEPIPLPTDGLPLRFNRRLI